MSTYTVHNCPNCHTDHEWQLIFPSLQELFVIKEVTSEIDHKTKKIITPGMNGAAFMQGVGEFDPVAWAALFHILHKRDGIKIPVKAIQIDMENLEIDGVTMREMVEKAMAADAAGQDEDEDEYEDEDGPNPLPPSGQTARED